MEKIEELAGRTFKQAMLSLKNAVLLGVVSEGVTRLNPPNDTVIKAEDQLIVLELDDAAFVIAEPPAINGAAMATDAVSHEKTVTSLAVLGSNDKLPMILSEYDQYVAPGTSVEIIDDDFREEYIGAYENLNVTVTKCNADRNYLQAMIEGSVDNILLLNDDSHDPEDSDAETLLKLILLRDIADKTNKQFTITTEMQNEQNRELAAQARVDDFVIGANFACLLMAQISENPLLESVIAELLDESGSELYMKSASDYVLLGTPVDVYTLTVSAAEKNQVFVGYRMMREGAYHTVVNPDKNTVICFEKGDQIIVLSED
jgi:hypothetical protein